MLLRSLIVLALTYSAANGSELMPWKKIENLKCSEEFNKVAAEKNWDKENYREHLASFYKETVLRNQSTEIGEWLEVHMTPNSSPEMVFVKDNAITRFSFDKNCGLVSKNESWPWHLEKSFTMKTNEDWDNSDLRNLVSSKKKGMIYFWSPRFVYSVYELPKMELMAKKLGYTFTAVVDPRASKEEIEGALEVMHKNSKKEFQRILASKSTFLRNTSTDLYMRGEFNHFPVTYIYNNNKIHHNWITGIMKENGLKSLADTFSNELKGAK